METTTVTVRTTPDALVKIYNEPRDEVLFIDNANADGETTPITLPANGGHFFIDVTLFTDLTIMNDKKITRAPSYLNQED